MLKTEKDLKGQYTSPEIVVFQFEEEIQTGSEGSANVGEWWFE